MEQIRQLQDREFTALRMEYDRKALETVPKKPDGSIDTASEEYRSLLDDYRTRRAQIRDDYSKLDSRSKRIESILEDPEYKGRILNTGSAPKNVNADVDLKAADVDAAQKLSQQWSKRKNGKSPLYYTVDSPNTPTTKAPEDFNKVVKIVDPETDTTLWAPETEEIRKVKIGDHDAWTTSGGQKATGNIEMSRDKKGYFLDNEKKFIHADRPVSSVPGAHDEDLKTLSKSASKAGGEQGANLTKNNPDFYDQADTLRKYGDPVEAGIVNLGDGPEVRKQKIEAWKQSARDEMVKAGTKSEKLGEAADKARADLARQMKDQGHDDIADRIEANRRKIADSNRDAGIENERLRQQNEDLGYGTKQKNTSVLAEDAADGIRPNTDLDSRTPAVDSLDAGRNNAEEVIKIKVKKPDSVPGRSGDIEKMSLRDVDPDYDPDGLKKAQGAFTKDGGIKRDPDSVKYVKGDPDLADLADPSTKHVKEVTGDEGLADLSKQARDAEIKSRYETKAEVLESAPDGGRNVKADGATVIEEPKQSKFQANGAEIDAESSGSGTKQLAAGGDIEAELSDGGN